MIYESDRNMPMSSVRNSYEWESELALQERACHAIATQNPELLLSAITAGASIHHPVRPLLVEAARGNKYTAATHLLALGADVKFADKSGITAMAGAAKHGSNRLIDLFYQLAAEIDSKDRWGTTPLMEAVYHGHLRSAEILVGYGANVNERNGEGLSVLAHVRHGRTAWESLRAKSHRAWRDRRGYRLIDVGELREHYEEDFAMVQAVDQIYQEIGTYLVGEGAIDCKTPIPFLTFPKKEKRTRLAA